MKLKRYFILFCTIMCLLSLAGCGTDMNTSEVEDSIKGDEQESKQKEEIEKKEFQLTQAGKEFLNKMCYYLPEFESMDDINDEFWNDFIFYSYTGISGDDEEMVEVYREDLDFKETEVKVSKEKVSEYVKLALGLDLPVYEPAFEDMKEGQTAFYYKDGYYYIGVSDFGSINFKYDKSTTNDDGTASIEYIILIEEESQIGNIIFTVSPSENENGFIIKGKSKIEK